MSLKFHIPVRVCVCLSHSLKKETARRRCGRSEFYGFMIQKKMFKVTPRPQECSFFARHMSPGVCFARNVVSLGTINLLYANIALPFCLAKRLSLEREDNRRDILENYSQFY